MLMGLQTSPSFVVAEAPVPTICRMTVVSVGYGTGHVVSMSSAGAPITRSRHPASFMTMLR